mgnify:CR=1 FL=1
MENRRNHDAFNEEKKAGETKNLKIHIPKPLNCTDNGAMIAYIGAKQLSMGDKASLGANAYASKPMW